MQPLATIFNNTFFWIFLLFFIPVITMRLISEERKSGSIETLLTSPVTATTNVLGKFAAALAFYAVFWLPVAAYALILNRLMTIDLKIVLSSLLAVMLIGAYFLAVGTFASCLSKNQIIAAILGFVMIIVIFSAGSSSPRQRPGHQGSLLVSDDLGPHGRLLPRHRGHEENRVLCLLRGALPLPSQATLVEAKKGQ
jgi:ABC-type transport system involved in multi-copper enzyme maturation permease subunit